MADTSSTSGPSGSGGFSGQNRNSSSLRGSGSKPFRAGRGGGGRGRGRGGHHRGDTRSKKRDLGRSEWSKTKPDKRTANDQTQQATKRRKLSNGQDAPLPVYATKFDEATLAAEERRPKKKVAVMIGYSGTGYKGMQLAPDQKTIEGDLFKAFVDAGAISKANADDPKKSSFVRCARTDKGVHAAGNVISLKLIVEDEDIVKKINDALVPQIRVWGFERTNNSFSSYQLCDSRIYEYLIPTHSFLPPHPRSFLGKKCREWAERKGELEAWEARQVDVKGYWEKVDEEEIKPILEEYPEDIRDILHKALWLTAEHESNKQGNGETRGPKPDREDVPMVVVDEASVDIKTESATQNGGMKETNSVGTLRKAAQPTGTQDDLAALTGQGRATKGATTEEAEETTQEQTVETKAQDDGYDNTADQLSDPQSLSSKEARIARRKLIDEGVKRLRAVYVAAKRRHRIPESRKQTLQDVLNLYLGTRNFWNYTIQKTFRDPSAKRVIKSFKVNPTSILIDGTEWLSLKVHGQSFMMHQIRKMVGMAALIVRCGCDANRIVESYGPSNVSIPKAPSLGLLLERPVFDSYNKRAKTDLQKKPIDFDKYTEEMDKFKQQFIYERMYHDEERDNVFGNFFNHVDNFPSNTFLFVTSGGLEASGEVDGPETGAVRLAVKSDEDDDDYLHAENVVEVDSDDDLDGVRDNAGDEG